MTLLKLTQITKSYGKDERKTVVLDRLNLAIEEGEMLAVMGKSGSGKTTLLNIIAGIDYPDDGEYEFLNEPVNLRKTSDGVRFRRNRIGIIVQHFALINDFTVYENVEMGLWETKMSQKDRRIRTMEILDQLDIQSLAGRYPPELSGGEKQRTAIGRAIVGKPRLILADEPTGALDNQTEHNIMDILTKLNQDGTTMMIITHDEDIAKRCTRVVELKK